MAIAHPGKPLDMAAVKVACANCNLHNLCLPLGIDIQDIARLDDSSNRKRPLARGEFLFQAGAPFHAIYAIRSGSVKTFTATEDGQEQVTGFHLPGELVGLDAISSDTHNCSARALETTSVCEIPYAQLEDLSTRVPSLQRQLLRVMSREILQDDHMMMLLGRKAADERLAAMLMSISNRFKQRGFSPREFHLSMSRNDIGNYLGLAVETVSRLFTRFQEEGILETERKHVRILDLARLSALAGANRITPKD